MRWNGVPIFKDKSAGFPTIYWGWDELSEDYPNTADNTELFDFTRHLVHYSSSKPTREYLFQDLDEPDTNVYNIYNYAGNYPALMYFSFKLPAQTTIQIEGKFQGYSYYWDAGDYGTCAVYATATKPTSTSNKASTADAVLYNGANKNGYSRNVYSSQFNTYTATLTNDTDSEKTYYMVLQVEIGYPHNNYKDGLYVKYLKFTKI